MILIDIALRVEALQVEHPDWVEDRLVSMANSEVRGEYMTASAEEYMSHSPSRDDGLIQLRPGDYIYVDYLDATNDYGEEELLSKEILYGVWGGFLISETIHWGIDDSPIFIASALSLYGCNVTIDAGVEVKMTGNYGINLFGGSFTVNGSEDSLVTFLPRDLENAEPGAWQGIYSGYSQAPGTDNTYYNAYIAMDHFILSYASNGIHSSGNNWNQTRTLTHGEISYCSSKGYYDDSWDGNYLYFEEMNIHNNNSDGIYLRYKNRNDFTILNSIISYNSGSGVYYADRYMDNSSNAPIYLEGSVFQGNGGSGIHFQSWRSDWGSTNIPITITACSFIDNNQNGINFSSLGYQCTTSHCHIFDIMLSDNEISNNGKIGLYLNDLQGEVIIGTSQVTITDNSISYNGADELYFGYIDPIGSEKYYYYFDINNNDIVDTTGYLVNMNFTFNDNEDRIGEEIRMRSNYWGEATTDEMNEGGNPKDITQLFDNFDDDNDRTQINYSNWVEVPFAPDNTQLGCLDESACNFSEDAIVDDGSCWYEEEYHDCDGNCIADIDCFGVCGGTGELDYCDVCDGDNTSCLHPSTEMVAYYFSSISLDGTDLTLEDEIVARNDSTGSVVGYGTYQNVGDGYTEIIVYGEMSIGDSTFNTEGYMLSGDTPQFYINDIKVEYFAVNGTLLHDIPPLQSPSIFNNLTMDLVTDCNGYMGGGASIDYCAECYGGGTGLSEGWHDTDGDSICDPGAANGDADNCIDTANTDQWNYDGDEEGDACDGDDDNDGAADDLDSDDNNEFVCNDDDDDTCDECSSGYYDSANDGDDYDMDGACNDGDDDDDNDTVLDADDSEPLNEFACQDIDIDNCDDCSQEGMPNTANDGLDNDEDGWCNDGDPWPDCSNDPIDADPYDECGNCNGDGFADECIGTDDCNDMACDGDCDQVAYIDDCGECDDSSNTDCLDLYIDLHIGSNLISFYALAEDVSVGTIFGDADGVLTEGAAAFNNDGNWIGSLEEVSQDDGYWVIVSGADSLEILGADPINYDADGEVIYDMHYGPNLISYPFQTAQYLDDALSDASDNVYALLGEGMAALNCANNPCDDGWVGSWKLSKAVKDIG